MPDPSSQAQEEAKKKQQEEAQRKAQEEAQKKAQETARAQEAAKQSQKQEESSKRQNPSSPSKGMNTETARGNQGGYGYNEKGEWDPRRAQAEWKADQKRSLMADNFSVDPYANQIRGKSFRQTSPAERNAGVMGEADQARAIRQRGEQNLRTDVDFMSRQFGHEVRSGLDRSRQYSDLVRQLEQKTGVKAESTGGLGGYNESDMAKYMATPEVKTYVDQVKLGHESIEPVEKLSMQDQRIKDALANKQRLAEYKTDFERDLEGYQQRKSLGLVQTTKGQRLDTVRSTDPYQKLQRADTHMAQPGGFGTPKTIGGSSDSYGSVLTNQPAKTAKEYAERKAKFEQIGRETRLAEIEKKRQKAQQQMAETPAQTEQRIARREKELGIGRFASTPSYFDDKSRGRRI